MSLTTKYGNAVNIMFDENPSAPATTDNTLHLFALNGIQTKDFEKTVNTERAFDDQRQIIKNPVRFKQLEIGGQLQTTDTFLNAGSKIISEANPLINGNQTNLILSGQDVGPKSFRIRNLGAITGNQDLIDTGGGQQIKTKLSVTGTTTSDLLVGFSDSYSTRFLNTHANASSSSNEMTLKGAYNSILMQNASGPGVNQVKFGQNTTTQNNQLIMTGATTTNNIISIGDTNYQSTNTFNMQSAVGGSSNMYIGSQTALGSLTISGSTQINKITTDMGVDNNNTTLPTCSAVRNYYGTSTSYALNVRFDFAGQTLQCAYYQKKNNNMTYYIQYAVPIQFTTTENTNTDLVITLPSSTVSLIGSTIFASYVEFGDGSFTPIIGKLTSNTVITVKIKGNGFTGLHVFDIPPFCVAG